MRSEVQWTALQRAVETELPFPPPYQFKCFGYPPHPDPFDADVDYWGDWSDACLRPFEQLEWLRVRPRYLKHRGRLVAPEVVDIEREFVMLLERLTVPYERDGEAIVITVPHRSE
ncbi:MAG: DUF6678 family protein [Gammaproteobacteria bacterium]